jgi:type III secretion protein D
MYELRILSGLHRGATLPLHDESHTIGASDEADVVLVDPSIKERHATLSKTEAGWLLSTGDGPLFDAETNREQSLIDLLPGDFARIGDVWIAILLQDAPWVGAPPVPLDESLMDEELVAAGAEASAQESMEAEGAAPATAGQAPQAAVAEGRPAVKRKWRGTRIALGVMATTVVLSAAAAYAMTSKSVSSDMSNVLDPMPGSSQSVLEKEDKAERKTKHMAFDAKNSGSGKGAAALTPEALRKAFRKRLADADLLQQFDLTLNDESWQMQGNLDEEDARRFDQLLRAFMSEHHIAFPVHAKIVSSEGMLPFKISQVISGANPNIVTQEGQRLFVGEEFRGMRLVAIQDNHLTFAGKRKIEMNW